MMPLAVSAVRFFRRVYIRTMVSVVMRQLFLWQRHRWDQSRDTCGIAFFKLNVSILKRMCRVVTWSGADLVTNEVPPSPIHQGPWNYKPKLARNAIQADLRSANEASRMILWLIQTAWPPQYGSFARNACVLSGQCVTRVKKKEKILLLFGFTSKTPSGL